MLDPDELDAEWDDEVDDSAGEEDDTLPCPACGAQVYDDTDQCPQCGEWIMPLSVSSRPNRTILLVVVVMIALMVMLALL